MRTCQHCRELVEDSAGTHCPHCGVVLSKTRKPIHGGGGYVTWANRLEALGKGMMEWGTRMTLATLLFILLAVVAALLL